MPPSVYDTPPNGDFARYVEELGQQATLRLLHRATTAVQDAASPAPPRRGRAPTAVVAAPQDATASGARMKERLAQLFQWGLAALVVFVMASAAYPPLALAALPLLLAFGALAWVRLRLLPWPELMARARKRAGLPSTDPGARENARHPH